MGKSLKKPWSVSIGPLFSKYDWMGACHSGLYPLFVKTQTLFSNAPNYFSFLNFPNVPEST